MNATAEGTEQAATQLSVFDAVLDLLRIQPIFLLGVILIGIALVILLRKSSSIPKVKTAALSLLLYYYLCVVLTNIVGIPTLREWIRVSRLGEAVFNPNVSLIPLADGIRLSFILNIFLFIPLGFLCPLISKAFRRPRNTLLVGVGLSALIEVSQLFTLYRATDIDDLITNGIGTMLGFLCFWLLNRLRLAGRGTTPQAAGADKTAYLPIICIAVAFALGFFG